MLDEQHRLALVGEAAQGDAELLGLGAVQAGGRLVEAQQLRLGHQGAGDADQLALARRQLRRLGLARPVHADQGESLLGVVLVDAAFLRGDGEVLDHAQVVEQLGRLPGAGKAAARPVVGGQPAQVALAEADASRRVHEAGDGVDERGLARAVRSDEAEQLPLLDVQRHVA